MSKSSHTFEPLALLRVPLDELCKRGKEIGLQGIDLLTLEEVPTAQKYDLTCSMVHFDLKGYGIPKGFNRIENHKDLVAYYEDRIPKAANLGLKNIMMPSTNSCNNPDFILAIVLPKQGLIMG